MTKWAIGVLVLGAFAACTKATPVVDAGPPPPPAVKWEGAELSCAGEPTWKLGVAYDATGARLTVAGWPKGTTLATLGTTFPSDAPPPDSVPLGPFLGTIPVFRQNVDAGVYFPPDLDVPPAPLEIHLPSGAVIVTTLPAGKAPPLLATMVMAKAARDGLVFQGEGEAAPSGPHSIWVLDPGGSDEVVGPAKTLAEVDWIAASSSKVERSASGVTCAFAGGKAFPLEGETRTITITARRTKAKIDEKVFGPAPGCPMVALDEHAIAAPPRAAIVGWLAEVAAHDGR